MYWIIVLFIIVCWRRVWNGYVLRVWLRIWLRIRVWLRIWLRIWYRDYRLDLRSLVRLGPVRWKAISVGRVPGRAPWGYGRVWVEVVRCHGSVVGTVVVANMVAGFVLYQRHVQKTTGCVIAEMSAK